MGLGTALDPTFPRFRTWDRMGCAPEKQESKEGSRGLESE